MSGEFVVRLEPKDVAGAIDIGVRKAIAEALGAADQSKLIEAVVNAAMSETKDPGYGKRQSLFAAEVDKLIRKEAEGAVAALLADLRPSIHAALEVRLEKALDPTSLALSLVSAFDAALAKNMFVSVSTRVDLAAPSSDHSDD